MNAVATSTESPGSQLLRAALDASVRLGRAAGEIPPIEPEDPMPGDKPEVRLAGETIDLLREEMALAAEAGAQRAVDALLTKERARFVFSVFFELLREEMASSTGNWMLGGIWGGMKKVGGFLLLVLVLLVIGGPGLLKALAFTVWQSATGKS